MAGEEETLEIEEPRTGRRRRFKSLSFNRILPNMLTLLAVCAGLTAIRYAVNEQFDRAVIAIVIAGIIDGLDGRIARLLRGTTKFGAELDSLADAVNFGVVPAMVIYFWIMDTAGSFGWALCLLHTVCCILRLARFNTMIGSQALPPWAHSYFTGVPAPSGAGLALLPLILFLETGSGFFDSRIVVGFFLLLSSILMVSRVPTYSLKSMRIKPSWILPFLIGFGAVCAFLVTDPWLTLGAIGFAYLFSIPFAAYTYRQNYKRSPPPIAPPTEPTPA